MKNDDMRLKPNEIVFFVDYNNTFVDYANEFDSGLRGNWDDRNANPALTRHYLIKTLTEFENATGITPRICIVTNAHIDIIDLNGYPGIFQDVKSTFFGTEDQTLAKYIKYLVYRENDGFFKINPNGDGYMGLFEYQEFDDSQKMIRFVPEMKKLETVSRMMSLLEPEMESGKMTGKYILFAGDSIKDDYPMMKFNTPQGVSKVFVRPRKVQKMSKNLMWKFSQALGDKTTSVNPKTKRPFAVIDDGNFEMLSESDKKIIENYACGGRVLLTQKNSRGFMDGIRELQKMIVSGGNYQKQFGEE